MKKYILIIYCILFSNIIFAQVVYNMQNLTVYDFYKEEQIKKCYEHFNEYLKNSVLLNSENIRSHAIAEANENDKDANNYYLLKKFSLVIRKLIKQKRFIFRTSASFISSLSLFFQTSSELKQKYSTVTGFKLGSLDINLEKLLHLL